MSERANEFIQQAGQALNDSAFARAAELADQALAADPNSADAFMLKGIALAQSNQPDAATQAFRQAIAIAPSNFKAHFNLAAHEYQQGHRLEALTCARQALAIDPSHAGARSLAQLLENETGGPRPVPPAQTNPYQSAQPSYGPSPVRPGYEASRSVHSLAFVERMGSTWVVIGWVITAIVVLNWLWSMYYVFQIFSAMMNNSSNLRSLGTGTTSILNSLLGLFSFAGMIVWTCLDIADRRGNWLWVIVFVLCGGIGMPVYMLAGRKS